MSDVIEMPAKERQARNLLRTIQRKYGPRITPAESVEFGNGFRRALDMDPTGGEALHYVRDIEERVRPYAS